MGGTGPPGGGICEVVITADDADWLVGFTEGLVRDRLAACGQHVLSIRSVYRWEGAVQDDVEARVALHTRASLVPAIVARADREHGYDVPCVIALPVIAGNPDYVEWVLAETGGPERGPEGPEREPEGHERAPSWEPGDRPGPGG